MPLSGGFSSSVSNTCCGAAADVSPHLSVIRPRPTRRQVAHASRGHKLADQISGLKSSHTEVWDVPVRLKEGFIPTYLVDSPGRICKENDDTDTSTSVPVCVQSHSLCE